MSATEREANTSDRPFSDFHDRRTARPGCAKSDRSLAVGFRTFAAGSRMAAAGPGWWGSCRHRLPCDRKQTLDSAAEGGVLTFGASKLTCSACHVLEDGNVCFQVMGLAALDLRQSAVCLATFHA